jgi:hypothetical protein
MTWKNLGDRIVDPALALVMLGLLGSGLASFGIYLIRPVDSLGQLMAWLCIYRQSCDFNTNLVSIALGLYLSLGVFIILAVNLRQVLRDWAKIDEEDDAEANERDKAQALEEGDDSSGTGMYDQILRVVRRAEDDGVLAIDVSRRTGYNIMDVHTMLGILWEGGEDHVTRYYLRETEEEKAARLKRKEERAVIVQEARKLNLKPLFKSERWRSEIGEAARMALAALIVLVFFGAFGALVNYLNSVVAK